MPAAVMSRIDYMSVLNIAEILFENGSIHYRYARKMSADGTRWVRDGLFQAYHENGSLASEGTYRDGSENGIWRDFHHNGQLAAEGNYSQGNGTGQWRYWNPDGSEGSAG